eukprot:CAMPEP_0177795080 /NCGR_PEP_ID=MMETSP0491_2-20121128/26018_1 /TAXON_ID=63592 /ORGANISM="Tetraselmis chuii, Strain PLY429" /LENGTH=55 /DNA_ID=CAMNT_0019317839 /DNA_START=314 /DNA_END=481 /DNA_ORIENTATION=-
MKTLRASGWKKGAPSAAFTALAFSEVDTIARSSSEAFAQVATLSVMVSWQCAEEP